MGARSWTRRGRMVALAACAATGVIATVGSAAAATSDVQVTINTGALVLTTPNFQSQSATLTGSTQTISTTPAVPWSAIDARGTGAAWSVVASATNLVSTGTPNRTIASSNLAITTGTVTAGAGADAAAGITGTTGSAFAVPTGAGQTDVTLLSASGLHRGLYTFTPQLDITIPGSALASYGGSPYGATLTVTIS